MPLIIVVVVVVAGAPLKKSIEFSASELSESGVADLVPSLSSPPPRSLAKSAAATASQEEAGAGGWFIVGAGAVEREVV